MFHTLTRVPPAELPGSSTTQELDGTICVPDGMYMLSELLAIPLTQALLSPTHGMPATGALVPDSASEGIHGMANTQMHHMSSTDIGGGNYSISAPFVHEMSSNTNYMEILRAELSDSRDMNLLSVSSPTFSIQVLGRRTTIPSHSNSLRLGGTERTPSLRVEVTGRTPQLWRRIPRQASRRSHHAHSLSSSSYGSISLGQSSVTERSAFEESHVSQMTSSLSQNDDSSYQSAKHLPDIPSAVEPTGHSREGFSPYSSQNMDMLEDGSLTYHEKTDVQSTHQPLAPFSGPSLRTFPMSNPWKSSVLPGQLIPTERPKAVRL